MNDNLIFQLYSRPETVFTVSEIAQLSPQISYESLRDRLYYFAKVGKLVRVKQGIYAKKGFNFFELVNKIYTPSYISLETVLGAGGVTFQYYETVFAISYLSREINVESKKIQYRQIKDSVLTNSAGLEQKDGYYIATLERAFLDTVYVYENYYFDNLRPLDWEKVEKLKTIYHSRILESKVAKYHAKY